MCVYIYIYIYIYTHTHTHWTLAKWLVFTNGLGDLGSKTQNMVLDATLLNPQVRTKGEMSNSGKGIAPFPTPWCSSYQKESLRVTLNYSLQLYLYIYTNHSARAGCNMRSFFKQFCRFEFSFPSPSVVAISSLKSPVCSTIYL